MLRVDGERQEHMRHMIVTQTQHEQQMWYEQQNQWQEHDFDHFEVQRSHEEQRLKELLQRRREELSENRKRVTDRKLEILRKEHEVLVRENDLELQRAADCRARSAEDDRIRIQRQEIDDSICRLKAKRVSLQGGMDDQGSWSVEDGVHSKQAVGGA